MLIEAVCVYIMLGGTALYNSYFGVSVNPILIYRLSCDPFLSNIKHCNQHRTPHYPCSNNQEAGIICEGR